MGLDQQNHSRRLRDVMDRAVRGGRAGTATPATDTRADRARGRSMMEYITPFSINSPMTVVAVGLYGRATYGSSVYWRHIPR